MDLTLIPVPTAADAGIERRVQMKNHGTVIAVLVIYRHSGHKFEAAAKSVNDTGRGLTAEQALAARTEAGAAALRAVQVQVEEYNRAILPAPQLLTPDVPPCHYSPALLRPKAPAASPFTGSSLPIPAPRSTVSG